MRLKVPQIGWNQLHHTGTDPLLAGVPDGAYAYFVHSYYCAPDDPTYTVATPTSESTTPRSCAAAASGASSATRRRARRWDCGFWGISCGLLSRGAEVRGSRGAEKTRALCPLWSLWQ